MTTPARRFALVAAAAITALTLSACTHGFGSNLPEAIKVRQQAQTALTRWSDAATITKGAHALVVVGDITRQVGDWKDAVGDNDKQALMAGLLHVSADLPAAPPTGTVTWQDGTTSEVDVMSAQETVAAIQPEAGVKDCPGCTALEVIGARLINKPVTSIRGTANVPIWVFTLKGTAVTVTRIAVADTAAVTLTWWVAPPWGDDGDAPVGIAIDSANGTAGATSLVVGFAGAPLPGVQHCGADYTAEALESDLAIAVIVTAHSNSEPGPCDAAAGRRTAIVGLAKPLGLRTVLTATDGRPVLLTAEP